jgi:hypothetical protein
MGAVTSTTIARVRARTLAGLGRFRRHHFVGAGRFASQVMPPTRGSPIQPTNPYRRDRYGVSETMASVSSSFSSGREGMGDFGIVFLRGGERFGKLGR